VVVIIKRDERDADTAQTPGMRREAGISDRLTSATGLWMGVGVNEPGGCSAAHHHGGNESGIYVLRGRLRFYWGRHLEHVQDAGPGDFIFVPPWEVHIEENLDPDEPAEFIVARNSQEGVVVNVPDPRTGTA
jgi:uncharacterized RmlC-like cupin family protein